MSSDLPKLVRDNTPDKIREEGKYPVLAYANDRELVEWLIQKVINKSRELTHTEVERLLEVAGDVKAALDQLYKELELTESVIARITEGNGHADRSLLEHAEALQHSIAEKRLHEAVNVGRRLVLICVEKGISPEELERSAEQSVAKQGGYEKGFVLHGIEEDHRPPGAVY